MSTDTESKPGPDATDPVDARNRTVDGRRVPDWLAGIANRFEYVFDIVDAIWDLPVVRGFMGWIAVLGVNIGLALFLDQMTGSVPWFPGAWQDASTGMVVLVCLLIFRAIYSPQAARAELERRRRAELRKVGLKVQDVDPVKDAVEEAEHLRKMKEEMGDGLTPHKKRALFYSICSAAMFSVYLIIFMQCVIEDPDQVEAMRKYAEDNYAQAFYEYDLQLEEYEEGLAQGDQWRIKPVPPTKVEFDHRIYVPLVMPKDLKQYIEDIGESEGRPDAFAVGVAMDREIIDNMMKYDSRHYVALTSLAFFWAYLLFTAFATASFAYLIAPEDFALDVSGVDAVFA